MMRLSDRLAPGENADELARDVLNVTLAGLQSGVALQSHTVVDCRDRRSRACRDARVS